MDSQTKRNPLSEIGDIAHLLPFSVLQDINQRIGDWLAAGGKDDDQYIEKQLEYAKRFVK